MNGGPGNLLLIQGGGPTAVLNTTLAAAIDEARASGRMGKILGAAHGMEGLLRGALVDLTDMPADRLESLRQTPGAALGSTRFKPDAEDLQEMVRHLDEHGIHFCVITGGNGSMLGGEALSRAAKKVGYDLCVTGAPKTVDNDIVGTDRCPGYASAARYVAQSVRDLGMDVRGLPQPVSVFETMGRSVGWLAGAAALAARDANDAPHLVYLPEKPFSIERCIADLDRVVTRLGWAVVVVSEGIRDVGGKLLFEAANGSQQDDCGRPLGGDVGAFLAGMLSDALKIRCRSEKPGLCGRASMLHVSEQDRRDAELVGRAAVRAALDGNAGQMVALRGLNEIELVPLSSVGGRDRPIPADWLEDSDRSVGPRFLEYAGRLVGPLPEYSAPLVGSLADISSLKQTVY